MSDIAIYEGGQLDGYRPQIMTPDAARELDEQLRACTRAVLRDGTDYGVIPGTSGEKVLYRPGAQKLLQWFGLTFTCDRTDLETDADGRKHGITYRAVVSRRGTGEVLATCEGTADYDESKFYKSADQVQREAEARERSWAKKDRRVANPTKWKDLPEYRAPWNTLVKRAQKRAIVGATIDATAAGGIFADDEDSDPSAPPDGGPPWYQRSLAEASSLTTKEDGRRLFAEAAQAGLNGQATRDQVTHVQNRVKQRVEQLETYIQVDFTDDVPPAQAAPPVPEPPADAAERGTAARDVLQQIAEELRRLRVEQPVQLRTVARLVARPLKTAADLTTAEAAKVADTLSGMSPEDLDGLLAELALADDPRDEQETTPDA